LDGLGWIGLDCVCVIMMTMMMKASAKQKRETKNQTKTTAMHDRNKIDNERNVYIIHLHSKDTCCNTSIHLKKNKTTTTN